VPKQINTHLPGSALVRKFGLKGRFQPVLDEVIVPVISVGQTQQTERRLATGGQICSASGAGNQNIVYFGNPVNSGITARISAWWASSGTVGDFYNLDAVPGPAPLASGTQHWRESARPGVPVCKMSRVAGASAVLTHPKFAVDIVYYGDWAMAPGSYIAVRQHTPNDVFDISFLWTEEFVTESIGG